MCGKKKSSSWKIASSICFAFTVMMLMMGMAHAQRRKNNNKNKDAIAMGNDNVNSNDNDNDNDDCVNAVPLLFDVVTDGTNVGSSVSSYCRPTRGPPRSGVWYTLVGTGNRILVTTCNIQSNDKNDDEGETFLDGRLYENLLDARLYIHEGGCSSTKKCIDGLDLRFNDACPTALLGSEIVFDSREGIEYVIYVTGTTLDPVGRFRILATDMSTDTYPESVLSSRYARNVDNDDCGNAIELTIGDDELVGSTVNANRENRCPGFDVNDEVGGVTGVWYKIRGTGNTMMVSTCSTSTNFNAVVSVRDGGCNAECIFNDNIVDAYISTYCTDSWLGGTFTWDSKNGVEYRIFVAGMVPFVTGTFGITAKEVGNTGSDTCGNAMALTVGEDEIISTTENSERQNRCSGFDVSDDLGGLNGVWYKVEGTGSTMMVSTCSTSTNFNAVISVRNGSCNAECVFNDNIVDAFISSYCTNSWLGGTFTWDSTYGTDYKIFVAGMVPGVFGRFGITVRNVQRPASDDCQDAIPLTVGDDEIVSTTENAVRDSRCLGSRFDMMDNDIAGGSGVWYTVQGTGKTMSISTCSEFTNFNAIIAIREGNCDGDCLFNNNIIDGVNGLSCDDSWQGETFSWSSDVGVDYKILVAGVAPGVTGTFGISVREIENADCDDAIELTVGGSEVIGTTANVVRDSRCLGLGLDVVNVVGAYGVWYTVQGTGNTLAVSTCSEYTDFNAIISVRDGRCSGRCLFNNNLVDRITNLSCGDSWLGETFSWYSTYGVEYKILVAATSPGVTGTFGIRVREIENDECEAGTELYVNDYERIGTTENVVRDRRCLGLDINIGGVYGVWYTVRGTGNEMVVSTCSEYTTFNAVLSVRDDDCNGDCMFHESIRDALNGFACGNTWLGETFTWNSINNVEYKILVSGMTPGMTGEFGITVKEVEIPINDECTKAIELSVGVENEIVSSAGSAVRDSRCVGWDLVNNDVAIGGVYGVWYTISGNGNTITVSTCSESTNFNAVIIVREGSCDGDCLFNDNIVDGINNLSCEDSWMGETFTWDSTNNVEYKILVAGVAPGLTGTFGLTVTDMNTPERPENDECEDAIPLTLDGPEVIASTESATSDSRCVLDLDFNVDVIGLQGVWYVIEGTGGTMIASTCSRSTNYDATLNVRSDGCDGNCILNGNVVDRFLGSRCTNDSLQGQTFSWNSRRGTEYRILVAGSSGRDTATTRRGGGGTYGITVTTMEGLIPPVNDACENAVSLTIDDPEEVVGSTWGATTDRICENVVEIAASIWYTVRGNGNTLIVSTCSLKTQVNTLLYVVEGNNCNGECLQNTIDVVNQSCDNDNDNNMMGALFSWESKNDVDYFIAVSSPSLYGGGDGYFGIAVTTQKDDDDDTAATPTSVPLATQDDDDERQQTPANQNSSARRNHPWSSAVGMLLLLLFFMLPPSLMMI